MYVPRPKPLSCQNRTLTLISCHFEESYFNTNRQNCRDLSAALLSKFSARNIRWLLRNHILAVGSFRRTLYCGQPNDYCGDSHRPPCPMVPSAKSSPYVVRCAGLPWELNFNSHWISIPIPIPFPQKKTVGTPTEFPYPQNPEILHTYTPHPAPNRLIDSMSLDT